MRVIHFTHGATDPLKDFDATGASFLLLADGNGSSHLSCLHLETGAKVSSRSLTHAAALLCVHGRITISSEHREHREHREPGNTMPMIRQDRTLT